MFATFLQAIFVKFILLYLPDTADRAIPWILYCWVYVQDKGAEEEFLSSPADTF